MSVTHSGTAKAAATNAVTGLLGTGAVLSFRTAGTVGAPGARVATLPMATPSAFGAAHVTTGIATAGVIAQDSDAAGGTVATATLDTSGGTVIIHGLVSVPAGGGNLELTNGLTIAAHDIVTCSSLTYQAIPS